MKEILQILEEQIRKDLPRLKELREGCWFKSGYGEEKLINVGGENDDKFLFIDVFKNHYEVDEIPKHYKIIGHDILLSDVLEWLKELELSNKIGTFEIGFTPMGRFAIKQKETIVFWNLNKTHLKDQSDRLIEFLYNLIEE